MTEVSKVKVLDERVRTDVRMSKSILKILGQQGQLLGIPKNSMFVMGACLLAARLAPVVSGGKKRKIMLDKVKVVFLKIVAEAYKEA